MTRMPSWWVPLAYSLGAVLAGITLPRFEAHFLPAWTSSMSVGAAITIYSAIATGMITLTGVVFSLVFVIIQLTASSYSPRLVLWLARAPLLYHSLGMFTATFLYALAALAWVDRSGAGRVPFVSVWLVFVLLLGSVGCFTGLVDRMNRLRIDQVLRFMADEGRRAINCSYPAHHSAGSRGDSEHFGLPAQTIVYHGNPVTIQAVNATALLSLAEERGAVIKILAAVGETLVESTPLVHVYGAGEPMRETAILAAFRTGAERCFDQDPKYAFRILCDIAIRALSPAVNDPTTAVQCLDQMEDLLVRIGGCRLETGHIRNSAGLLRVVIPVPTWHDFLDLALDEIRCYGAGSEQVMRRMSALLADLIRVTATDRHDAIRNQQKRLCAVIRRSFPDAEERRHASVPDREGLGTSRNRGTLCLGATQEGKQ